MRKIIGRGILDGKVKAEAIVSSQTFGFFGGVNPSTGIVIDRRHELFGQSIKGKVFIYPEGRGSTVGAAIMLELARTGCAPAAIVNIKIETITAAGGLLAKKFYNLDIPMVDQLQENPVELIKTGDVVEVNGTTGEVIISGIR
jgi:predicted aconitase with swiveling domain